MQQFKIGDWVREGHHPPADKEVYQLREQDFYGVSKKPKFYFERIKLWRPEEGEWCWFYDNFNNPFIGKFVSRDGDNYQYRHTKNEKVYSAYKCEPFIGELPSFLKD